MLWIYNLPNWAMCLMIVSVFVGGSMLGLKLVRPWVKTHCYEAFQDHNEAVSAFIGTFGVFYGITLGLIAVATWENFEEASSIVDQEAASLSALYRDVSAFPEPSRSILRRRLSDYLHFIINVAWNAHRHGIIPPVGLKLATEFEKELVKFEPTNRREEALFHETLDQFDQMLMLKQSRLDAVSSGLPDILWWVVLVGAVLNILLVYLIHIEPARTHFFLIGLLAAFIGLMVFLVAALDHPFRGQFKIGPEPFEQVQDTWYRLDEAGVDDEPTPRGNPSPDENK